MINREKKSNQLSLNQFQAMVPMLFFLLSVLISIFFSETVKNSLYLSAPFLVALVMLYSIVALFPRNDIINLSILLSFSALLLALISLLYSFILPTDNPSEWIKHVNSPILISPNDLSFLSVLTPFSVALLFLSKRFTIRYFIALVSIVACCIVVVYFKSRGATLSMLAGIIAVAILHHNALRISIISIILIMCIDALNSFSLLHRLEVTFDDPSFQVRTDLWRIAWGMFSTSPLIGHGMHTFMIYQAVNIPWAHNLYIEVMAQQGLVGFAPLLLTLITMTVFSWKISSNNKDNVLASSVFGASIAFAISAMVELSFLRMWVVIVFFLLVGIYVRICEK